MTQDCKHVEQLARKYPRLFLDKEPLLGMWFPSGWAGLMDRLCAALDRLLTDQQLGDFRVDQVKEKFGSLRFYYSVSRKTSLNIDVVASDGQVRIVDKPKMPKGFSSAAVDRLISAAETESKATCASCGAPGRPHNFDGWLQIACESCAEQHKRGRRGAGP